MSDQKPEGHVVKCGSCKGSGRDHIAPSLYACKVCKGAGSVLLK